MKNAFVFPGQGSQFVGMGKDLAENFASAREVFQEVDNTLNQNLFALMTGGPEHELTLTANTQPALMAVSMAVVRVLEKEFGIALKDKAAFVAGHSLGEYSAACAAEKVGKRGLQVQRAVFRIDHERDDRQRQNDADGRGKRVFVRKLHKQDQKRHDDHAAPSAEKAVDKSGEASGQQTFPDGGLRSVHKKTSPVKYTLVLAGEA